MSTQADTFVKLVFTRFGTVAALRGQCDDPIAGGYDRTLLRRGPALIRILLMSKAAGTSPPTVPTPNEGDSVVAERQEQRVEPPRMYQVVMLNDDYTPMEFVVWVLQEHFQRDLETATQIMLTIHHHGKGVCGVYSRDVAVTKVELVLAAAKRAGHPLQCTLEAA
jgi:ATP-dependent Clp protease adaptor protein ClpS